MGQGAHSSSGRVARSVGSAASDGAAPMAALGAVVPNPSAGRATVSWSLGEAGAVRLTVVDLPGREVAVLAEGRFAAGAHRAEVAGGRLSPGVYVVRLAAGQTVGAAPFTVVR